MNLRFSNRSNYVKASEIREMLKITEMPDVISFAGGLPAPELFPIDEIIEICGNVLKTKRGAALQYGSTEGYTPLRKTLAKMMHANGIDVDYNQVVVTTGSQQGLDLSGKVFIDEGDTVFCESPTYMAALSAFNAYLPNYIEIAMDCDGMLVDLLEEKLAGGSRPKFIYTVPDFQNPSGRTMSLARRKRLYEIASKYDLIIIEDNPYGELCFEGEKLPSIKSFDTDGRVVYLSTLSKTFSPGLRLGWVSASPAILNKYVIFKQGADLHTNVFAQMLADEFINHYDFHGHIEKIKKVYWQRKNAMLEAIKRYLPSEVKVTNPNGGLFLWMELPENMNSKKLLDKCLEKKVAFVTGKAFFTNGKGENTLRLNFSNMKEDNIEEGIRRIGEAIKELDA